MKFPRRSFLSLALGATAALVRPRRAAALDYPTRPVHWIVGFPPGGATDIYARLMGQWLSERLGQSFVIDNRPGAGSNIGTEAVANAPADGYTLLLISAAQPINATLYEHLNYNFVRDIAPVASFSREPNLVVVNPSVPVKTIPELIAYAKANPGKLTMASSGNGTIVHVSGELFKMMTGVNMLHVPYRGAGPAVTDLIAGQVQVMFATMPSSIEYVRAGKLRALAVTSAARSPALPDIPTVAEYVPGYESSAVYGVGAPKNVPAEIVDKLNREINTILADTKVKARLADLGGTVLIGSPADFGKLLAETTDKWAMVIHAANIKVD
jgi:tripartite-type tricarboxylate transporter receptor subunit TctC